jgi:predicted dehydrogenase
MSESSNNENESVTSGLSRRDLLKTSSQIAAASALAGAVLPRAYAAENNTLKLALVGCGGRGTGAAVDAITSKNGPVKLVAMADVFTQRLSNAYQAIKPRFDNQVDVPEERRFIGFDAYRKAMDQLKPGDIVILTTPPAFRWVHFTYAISKGLNVFMEKPTTVDGPSTRKMLALAEESISKNLKVAVGLMCRHCRSRQELFNRIKAGEIGDLTMLRAYRTQEPIGTCFTGVKPQGENEILYQIKNFHSFLWLSGGSFSDFFIHNIDECCWMKDAWPVEAKGYGGRHYRQHDGRDDVDQNFDSYTVEYTFEDGTKLFLEGRNMSNTHKEFASYAHASKGSAVISASSHHPSKARLYKGHRMDKEDLIWHCPQPEISPYQLEWDDLLEAIHNDKPYNEAKRGAQASLVTAMGRMACHTGKLVTYEEMLNCEHEFAPDLDKLAMDSPSPLVASADGRYPVPQPGILTKREY